MERKASSLRPTQSHERPAVGRRPTHSAPRSTITRDNPLKLFSENILDWNLLDNAVKYINPGNIDEEYENGIHTDLKLLPDVYNSFADYLGAWEPVMIHDIQEGTASKFVELIASSTNGEVVCTTSIEPAAEDSKITVLECSFGFDTNRKKRYCLCV